MKSPYSFLVTPINDRRYNNIKKIGEVDFITSTSEEDHKASNRFATVKATPLGYKGEIKKGDVLVVHHNVFKFYNDMYGRRKSGKSHFRDNLFLVDPDQFFLYKRDEEWRGHDKYCFVKPSEKKESFIEKGGSIEPLIGVIKYINKELEELGLEVGDEIAYLPDSEYEFIIDNEVLYRMFTSHITLKL
jgi:hypothetical protein|tara:strand:+ start:16942 stop:17505 length:564 start_codon:yes stop_codon:yes gene_type:complete